MTTYYAAGGVYCVRRRCRVLHRRRGRVRTVSDVSELEACDRHVPGDGGESTPETISDAISDGECPWCVEYEGDHVGQHASSAHPDAWTDYTERGTDE